MLRITHGYLSQEADTPLFKFRELLSYVSDENRLCFQLYYGEELTTREIADILHINESTIRSRMHREKLKLKTRKKPNKDFKKRFSNPVLAGKIPFLGRIFRLVENDISYSGNYSENAVQLTDPVNPNGNSQDGTPNADGIGISRVTKTPYEIKADIILLADADPFDYIVAITDADGKILDSQGQIAEIYSVYGRNTDTVHIYVVDYDTYMDECKAENAYLLPGKALFQTTVEW